MFETVLTALEGSAPAAMLRGSLWVYPVVNAGHIIGIALLFGGVVPMDLRLLGLWSKTPLAPLLRVLSTTAATGVGITVVCGTLLFITRASAYAGSAVFTTKMIVVAVGLLNGLLLRIAASHRHPPQWVIDGRVPFAIRFGAVLSITAWASALVLGRLIGYVN